MGGESGRSSRALGVMISRTCVPRFLALYLRSSVRVAVVCFCMWSIGTGALRFHISDHLEAGRRTAQ